MVENGMLNGKEKRRKSWGLPQVYLGSAIKMRHDRAQTGQTLASAAALKAASNPLICTGTEVQRPDASERGQFKPHFISIQYNTKLTVIIPT